MLSYLTIFILFTLLQPLSSGNHQTVLWGFPSSSAGKESSCNFGDPCLIPGSGASLGEGIGYPLQYSWASLVAQLLKNLPSMWETWVWSLGWRREWLHTPGFCPGEFQGLYSPWDHQESDTAEQLSLSNCSVPNSSFCSGWLVFRLHQFSWVTQSCPTLCDTMDSSTPGFPVHHQLPELTQTHVHWVGDAIQPSHPLSFPSPPTFNLSQHQGLFSESVLRIRWPKYWSFSFNINPFNEYSGLISFRIDWLDLLAVQGTLKSLL